MKFETKFTLYLTTALVVGFSLVNTVAILFLKSVVETSIDSQVKLIVSGYKYNDSNNPIPPYLMLREKIEPLEDYRVIGYTGKYFVLLDENYVKGILMSFAMLLIGWEIVLIIIILLLFYKVLSTHWKREQDVKDILNILLLSLTHRLGNFLSILRVNLELIGENAPAIRIKKGLKKLEDDYGKTLSLLKSLQEGKDVEIEKIDLGTLIEDLYSKLGPVESLKFIFVKKDVFIKANPIYLEILTSSLLENAFKYAKSFIHVKICEKEKALVIINDIKEGHGGSGMGLHIVKFTSSKIGAKVTYRIRKNFTVIVKFRPA